MKQNSFTLFLIVGLVFLLGTFVYAAPKKEKVREKVITGMIKIYGNEPHTWVGIETIPDGKIYVVQPPEKAAELRGQQGRLIEFKVVLEEMQMPLGGDGTATVISWRVVNK
jgi:hypothetical protein